MDSVVFRSTYYVVQMWWLTIFLNILTGTKVGAFALLDILHGTEMWAVDFCWTFYMTQMWALSSPARHSTWQSSGCWRVLLDIIHCTVMGAFVLLEILHCTEVSALEFCSTFYMVQKWALSSSVWHSTWYRSGLCRVLLDIYMVQNWALSSSTRHSTYYSSVRCRVLRDILHLVAVRSVESFSTFYMLQQCPLSRSVRHF